MDYSSTGAMRSPFSPRVRQSITGRRPIGLSSAKKNQSKFMQSPGEQTGDVVYKTPVTTIETYGMPLPVMVTEALTFASGEVSVRLSACGWCWVVSGRRIISWPRNSTISGTASAAPASTIARELSLPQTDLAHKADLVVLFYMEGAQMPSCIGVSPEGTVRYWPSVGQEGVYIDVSCELAGQECEKLGDYTPEGLVLATTTCTVVLLNPTVVDGRATVTCRTLRPPSGWLGGIGRRVSLLFFGSMPAHADTKLVGVVVLPGNSATESTIALVSGGPALQLWRGAELHEHSLRRALTDAHARTHLTPHGELNSLEIMALDVRASGDSALLLLIATVNVARSPEMRYAIAHICVEEPSKPRVTSVVAARGWAGEADEPPRFLPLAHRAILYTSKYIAIVSTTVANDKVDYIDVSSEGDKLLGAELCGGVPLLFSHKHGVLALSQPDAVHTTPIHANTNDKLLGAELCGGVPLLFSHKHGVLALSQPDAVHTTPIHANTNDKLLGAELCGGVPLLFSHKHGVLALSQPDAVHTTPIHANTNDKLLGAELCGGVPLLFSHKHGVLALSQPDAVHTTPIHANTNDKLLGAELCGGVPLLFSHKHGVLALSQPDAVHTTPIHANTNDKLLGAELCGGVPLLFSHKHGVLALSQPDAVHTTPIHANTNDKLLGAELCGGVPLLFSHKHGVLALSQPDAVHTTPIHANTNDKLLGAELCGGVPLLFSHKHGVLALSQPDAVHTTPIHANTNDKLLGAELCGGVPLLFSHKHGVLALSQPDAVHTTPRAHYAVSIHANTNDKLLGAELCGGVPLLFSHKHGVLALSQPDAVHTTPSMCESPMGSPCPSDMYDGNLSLYEIDPNEVSMVTTDACGKLKTAFLFHVRRDAAACRALLGELFPSAREDERDVDGVLDRSVLRIATDMLDDIPAGDPRWKQRLGGAATNICLGSSAALQVAAQLRDKQRAFSLFCDFLRAVGLWQRLGLVTRESGGGVVSTESALCGLAEQLSIAVALRRLQQGADAQLIDAAIYQVVCGENPEVEEDPEVEAALSSGALSPADVCYRRVSRASHVLRALAQAPPPAHDARAQASHAAATINILTSVLSQVHGTRAQWGGPAVTPALGPGALLPALGALLRRGAAAAAGCPDATLRAQLFEAAAALADLILTDAEHLNSEPHTQHVYERIRREAIQPFIDEGQTERAAVLAEKFKDFELLIEMCIKSNDLEKLFSYIDKYSNEGIASVTFARLAEQGGARAATLLRRVGARYPAPLRAWLRAAPARGPLLALHELSTQHYARAAEALLLMANEEMESVNRLTVTIALLERPAAGAARAQHAALRARRRGAAAHGQRGDGVRQQAHGNYCSSGAARCWRCTSSARSTTRAPQRRCCSWPTRRWSPSTGSRGPLLALHELSTQHYARAAEALLLMANEEMESVNRLTVTIALLERPAAGAARAQHAALRARRRGAAPHGQRGDGVRQQAHGNYCSSGAARCWRCTSSARSTTRAPQRRCCSWPTRRWSPSTGSRGPLLALHELSTQHYARAAEALLLMANEEMESVNRLTTTASLAKLCLVASDEPGSQQSGAWQRLESRLALAEQHAALPRELRLHHGLDAHDTRVLPPEDVVQVSSVPGASDEPGSQQSGAWQRLESRLALAEQHAALPRELRLHHGLDAHDTRVLPPEDVVQVSSVPGASDEPGSQQSGAWQRLESRLALAEQHAALPRELRLHHGLDAHDTRVLPPEDVVQVSSVPGASDEPGSQQSGAWQRLESRLALAEQHAALPRELRLHHGLDAHDTRVLPPEDVVQVSSVPGASDEPGSQQSGAWQRLESRLALAEQHAALPRELRLHHGLDAHDTRVLPPEDVVQMYVDSESKALTEYDYKKALDLTDYIQDMEKRDDLRLRVWCACIRRDDWSSCRVDAPADELQNKMFFRLIDLVHVMGGDLELLLPPAEDVLTARELADVVSDARAHFLIKYAYECVDATRDRAPHDG
ncbi:hypothetical protein PYW07_008173 [Mythimna separata]|uniref:Nucleoporin Nup133/Nup155-like N-terminal domain-containing protein n=1 Tax=Mythimna separata TaxID=271217 RepID=A0AAD7YRU4_MYTSE|nr:hypothetical protein PYW07_008173 [Mythimna separata]